MSLWNNSVIECMILFDTPFSPNDREFSESTNAMHRQEQVFFRSRSTIRLPSMLLHHPGKTQCIINKNASSDDLPALCEPPTLSAVSRECREKHPSKSISRNRSSRAGGIVEKSVECRREKGYQCVPRASARRMPCGVCPLVVSVRCFTALHRCRCR